MASLEKMQNMKELLHELKNSKQTLILTGAGMSVESGVPDFRSQSGWWNNIDPLTVATIEALENNYDLFHDFYSFRIKALEKCSPHEGHLLLAKWQQHQLIHHVSTQNVDGFHDGAGSVNVDHLHGSILTYRCHNCNKTANKHQFLNKENCHFCRGKLRPNIVLFGENLPDEVWNNTIHHIQKADLVIVIGTSLQVYPVSQLPLMTRGKTVYINKEVDGQQANFDFVIKGSAKETLIQIDQMM